MSAPMPLHVVIAGGGVAALETLLGLHELAGDRVHVTLLSDTTHFEERAVALGEPFGREQPLRLDLPATTAALGATFIRGWAAAVDVAGHTVTTREGAVVPYDVLVVATGVATRLPWARAEELDLGPAQMVTRLRSDVRARRLRRMVIAIPAEPHWPLPGYELALLLARDPELPGLELTVVTAERAPLRRFGDAASRAIAAELEAAGVRLVRDASLAIESSRPDVVDLLPSGEVLEADHVVAVPELVPHRLEGLPADDRGFLRTDAHGNVHGAPDVLAAGDCTDFALKQGGLAAQEADAVVLEIARRAGTTVAAERRAVVLRARVMTGAGDLWLRRDLLAAGDPGEVATHALWWPPAKLAGRWLAPYLQALRDARDGVPHPVAHGRVVEPGRDSGSGHGIDLLGTPHPAP